MPITLPVDALFSIANTLALVSWVGLIVLPRWRFVRRALQLFIVAGLCVLYAMLIQGFFFGVEGGGFFSLAAVQKLFTSREVALAGWVHYLAFDLFVGLWIAGPRRRDRRLALGAGADPSHDLHVRSDRPADVRGDPRPAIRLWAPVGCHRLEVGMTAPRRLDRPAATPLDPAQRMALDAAAICFALLLPTMVIGLVDTRLLDGASIWAKPLKFQFSFGLHLLTVAVLLSLLAGAVRRRAITLVPLGLATVCAALEVLYVTLQAARVDTRISTSTPASKHFCTMGSWVQRLWRSWSPPPGLAY